MTSIKDKLAFFDKKPSPAPAARPAARDDGRTELGLTSRPGDGGEVLMGERRVDFSQFTAFDLSAFLRLSGRDFSYIGKDWRYHDWRPEKLALFDTETTGLAGGSGTYIFLAGVTRLYDDHAVIRQYVLPDQSCERPFLNAIHQELRQGDGLISFNGRSYDLPLLRTRFIMNRIPFEVNGPHLDLLHSSRRLFRGLPSYHLQSIEEHLLRVRREEDVPGHLIPGLYFEALRTGDLRSIKPVLRHNAMDLLSLAGVAVYAANIFRSSEGRSARSMISVMKTLEALDLLEEAAGIGEQGVDGDPDALLLLQHRARYLKKTNQIEKAALLWEQVAADRHHLHLESYLELAKYYEHHRRDAAQALQIVDRIENRLEISLQLSGEAHSYELILQGIARRKKRLLKKLSGDPRPN